MSGISKTSNKTATCRLLGIAGMGLMLAACVHTPQYESMLVVNQDVPQFYSQKDLKLTNSNINQKLIVNGHLQSFSSRIGELVVNGNAEFENTTVHGKARINGTSLIKTSTFRQPMEVNGRATFESSVAEQSVRTTAPVLILDNTIVQRLYLEHRNGVEVHLRHGSKVRDSVVFIGGAGKVHIDPSSSVMGRIYHDSGKSEMLTVEVGK